MVRRRRMSHLTSLSVCIPRTPCRAVTVFMSAKVGMRSVVRLRRSLRALMVL